MMTSSCTELQVKTGWLPGSNADYASVLTLTPVVKLEPIIADFDHRSERRRREFQLS